MTTIVSIFSNPFPIEMQKYLYILSMVWYVHCCSNQDSVFEIKWKVKSEGNLVRATQVYNNVSFT